MITMVIETQSPPIKWDLQLLQASAFLPHAKKKKQKLKMTKGIIGVRDVAN